MDTSNFWWFLTAAAVGLELLTGTFYLLMLALGLTAGALATHAGLNPALQYLIAAVTGGGAVVVWHLKQAKNKSAQGAGSESNHDVHLDIGSSVEVAAWSASGTALVLHRGAQWSARHSRSGPQGTLALKAGMHRIVSVEGNTLVLTSE